MCTCYALYYVNLIVNDLGSHNNISIHGRLSEDNNSVFQTNICRLGVFLRTCLKVIIVYMV